MSLGLGRRGPMARELFIQLLREHGPMTNSELADLARDETDRGVWLFGWSIYPHMLRLEEEGRVERIQVARNHTILWTVRAPLILNPDKERK